MDSEYVVNIDEYARLNVNEIKETVNVFASKVKVRSTWLVYMDFPSVMNQSAL